jgi:hypothetical protein
MEEYPVKNTTLLLIAGLFFAPSLQTQEHAPSVEVCRADSAAWDDTTERSDYYEQETKYITDGVRNTNPVMKLSVETMSWRATEMGTCVAVDKPNSHTYENLVSFYDAVTHDRYRRFITRHNLMKQFYVEDAAGTR